MNKIITIMILAAGLLAASPAAQASYACDTTAPAPGVTYEECNDQQDTCAFGETGRDMNEDTLVIDADGVDITIFSRNNCYSGNHENPFTGDVTTWQRHDETVRMCISADDPDADVCVAFTSGTTDPDSTTYETSRGTCSFYVDHRGEHSEGDNEVYVPHTVCETRNYPV